jgi:S1-C subfamily serine protease
MENLAKVAIDDTTPKIGSPLPLAADLSANEAHCQGDAACQKLLAETAGSVFKVRGDHETGTGWIAPDGRLVTDYHVIMGNREITAEDNQGRVYRLGKDVAIDELHDRN